jgi:1-deoxy-D-xylulose-5-phosphate reductoisomerase
MTTVFNAANENAVAKFLNREISFLDIYTVIEECMSSHKIINNPTVSEILDTEKGVYEYIESRW